MRILATSILAVLALSAVSPGVAKTGGVKPVPVTLSGTALTFGPANGPTAGFGLRRADTIDLVAASLGKPLKQGTYPDCGQGIPIGYARFRGGLELAFIGGKFVGWALAEGGNGAMHTKRGIGLGSSRAALKKAYPAVSVDPDTSLGVMFSIDEDLGGFLANATPTAKVTALQAGQVCMVS